MNMKFIIPTRIMSIPIFHPNQLKTLWDNRRRSFCFFSHPYDHESRSRSIRLVSNVDYNSIIIIPNWNHLLILSYLSRSLAGCWGTIVDFTTSFLHSLQFSAFRSMMFHSRPVHSLMLSSHRFLCLPLSLPPSTVPCRIVLANPDDRVTRPYHFSLRLFTAVRKSSYGPMVFLILAFTSSLVMWSLYEIPRSLQKHLISNACILLSMSAVMVHDSHAYKNMDMARERISLILEVMAMFLSFQMTFSLVIAAVVWAILDSTSGLNPSSDTIAPRYLKLRTVSSFLLPMVMSVLMPLVLFVINWSSLHWSAYHMLWRPLQGDLSTWPALALVQLGRQCHQQNVSL